MTRYLSAEQMTHDDFGEPFKNFIGERVYDAKTIFGSWATMTEDSWVKFRASPRLGIGHGQKYVRAEDGTLPIAEGGSE